MNDEQRVKFEAFLIEHDSEIGHGRYHKYHPMYPDQYFDYNAHIAWLAWQAAQQVKPLEFVLEEEVWKAHTELGCICIFGVHDCRWVLYFDDDQCNNQRFATKAAAIEAANADYRKWVLSCLVWGWG